jgi:DNA-binding IclR family transcriptional regulator
MIQVINRAIDILEMLSQDLDKKYTLGEISDTFELNHSTCANIIKTMVNRGFVVNDRKKGGYSLGPKVYYLTGNFSYKKELLEIASEPMKNLETKLNENCVLASMKDNNRIILHQVTNTHELQVNTSPEKNVYLTATGRVMLAFKTPIEQEKFIQEYGLPKQMWPEVRSEKDLIIDLNKIKEKQMAIHHADSDIIGVAVPIFKKDKLIASLGVYLPETRFRYKKQELIFTELKNTAEYINKKLEK